MADPTDREFLELAAKAAGYKVRWHEAWSCFVHERPHSIDQPQDVRAGQRHVWVPLHDDGDALRLAVKLRLSIEYRASDEGIAVMINGRCVEELLGTDPYAATRRAIVRAAATIGASNG